MRKASLLNPRSDLSRIRKCYQLHDSKSRWEVTLLIKRSCWAAALVVTELTTVNAMIHHTSLCCLSLTYMFNKLASEVGFLNI